MTSNYPNIDPADESFVSVYGASEASAAGPDHVWGVFLVLRGAISASLRKMLALTGFDMEIDCEEEGIATRVRWLTVLVCARCQDLDFALGNEDPMESWREIATQCMRSEEWWRAVVSLDCEEPDCQGDDGVADPASQNQRSLPWNGSKFLDVGDYIQTCQSYVDDFFRYCRKRR